jgi:co-chaperonin GroES (HSP10)
MIPVPNVDLILIIPEQLEDTMKLGGKELEKSELQKENERKAQSRGTVFAVGENVAFYEEGDFVSFYRAAASEIKEDGVTYFSVNQANVLCKFVTNAD